MGGGGSSYSREELVKGPILILIRILSQREEWVELYHTFTASNVWLCTVYTADRQSALFWTRIHQSHAIFNTRLFKINLPSITRSYFQDETRWLILKRRRTTRIKTKHKDTIQDISIYMFLCSHTGPPSRFPNTVIMYSCSASDVRTSCPPNRPW